MRFESSYTAYQPLVRRVPSRERRWLRFSLALALITGIGVGGWYGARAPIFRVSDISVSGASVISETRIADAVREELAGVAFGFIPRDHFLFLSPVSVANAVGNQFPQLADISVVKRFPKKIRIAVRDRELWGLYCIRANVQDSPHDCRYLDTNGIAYEPVASVSGLLLPIVIGDEPVSLGVRAVSPEDIVRFREVSRALADFRETPTGFSRGTSTPEDISFQLASGWEIIVPASRPVAEWLSILAAILEQDVRGRRGELSYVDLRFGKKVFYKYR